MQLTACIFQNDADVLFCFYYVVQTYNERMFDHLQGGIPRVVHG